MGFSVGDKVRIISGEYQGGYGVIYLLLDDGTHCHIKASEQTKYVYVALADIELDA